MEFIPQTLIGASNSNRTGCDKKTCLDFWQRYAISLSNKLTLLPGRALLTKKQRIEQEY